MNIEKMFNKLCAPAKFYLVITTVIFVGVVLQNLINGKMDEFCIGTAKCSTPHMVLVFVLKVVYTLFWNTQTRILLCFPHPHYGRSILHKHVQIRP